MKLKAFAARDSKLGVFLPPFFMQHTGQALRAWEEVCNDSKSAMSKHPSDFQLFQVGEFDEETGLLVEMQPVQLASASEYRKGPHQSQHLDAAGVQRGLAALSS